MTQPADPKPLADALTTLAAQARQIADDYASPRLGPVDESGLRDAIELALDKPGPGGQVAALLSAITPWCSSAAAAYTDDEAAADETLIRFPGSAKAAHSELVRLQALARRHRDEARRLGHMVDEYGQGAGQLQDKVTRVRQLRDRLAGEDALTFPDDLIARGAAAELIAAALDGNRPAAGTDAGSRSEQ